VTGDSNQSNDIFIHNIATNTRSRLTNNLDSTLDAYGLVEYELLGLSEDVSKLMFSSNYETLDTASDLYQVYLMNINDNSVEILSQTIDGISGNDASLLGVMDSIGSNYAYQTNATNLLADIPGILITDVEDASEIIGTSQSDTLQSTDGPDSISALAGNDSINLTADSTWSSGYAALNVSNTNSVGTNEKNSFVVTPPLAGTEIFCITAGHSWKNPKSDFSINSLIKTIKGKSWLSGVKIIDEKGLGTALVNFAQTHNVGISVKITGINAKNLVGKLRDWGAYEDILVFIQAGCDQEIKRYVKESGLKVRKIGIIQKDRIFSVSGQKKLFLYLGLPF
jgi:hypothetical protein